MPNMERLDVLFVAVSLLVSFAVGGAQLSRNKTELLNWCMDTVSHKNKPGKEDSLHSQCTPWKEKACCTGETSFDVHEKHMYNFTLDHCSTVTGKPLSNKCRQYFDRNNCFYECEPHVGLWVVKTKRIIGTERFFKVPLCASDCEDWFAACSNDYTCAYNWPRNFIFRKGVNYCKDKCITFKLMFKTAQAFCENIWDESWKYTRDNEPCMKMWFDGENPNEKTAEHYIDAWLNGSTTMAPFSMWFTIIVMCLGIINT